MSLNVLDFLRITWRSLFMQASWNRERMLSLGFCFSAAPRIKKIFQTTAQRADYLRRNLGFFNTHPYFASYVLGAALKMEEQAQKREVAPAEIEKIKTHLSRSLGAVGDSFVWRGLKPLCAMLAMILSLHDAFTGLAAFLIAYNLPHIFVRGHGLAFGYRSGRELVKTIPLAKYQFGVHLLSNAGSFVGGFLVVYFLISEKTAGGLLEAGVFICGLILMIIFIKWRIAAPLALAMLLLFGLAAGLIF
jgi:mannose/fructose/N-acetylgalactosamine-specific phosphotransferase system component IID